MKKTKLKHFRYYWHNESRCETVVGVVIAETAELAKEVAIRHLKTDDVKIEELNFSEDGFCEVYYG